jgi:hypothetical protein
MEEFEYLREELNESQVSTMDVLSEKPEICNDLATDRIQ